MKFRLKKGKHYNQSKVRFLISLLFGLVNGEVIRRTFLLHLGKTMTRMVYFSEECWYPKSALDWVLDSDGKRKYLTGWNKLFGFFGFLIHMFSGRLVWQPDFDRPGWIRIALYVYNDSKEKQKWTALFIISVKVKTFNEMSVTADSGYYWGEIGDYFEKIPSEKTPHFLKGEPYFGGQSECVQDMNIYIWYVWYYKLFKNVIHKRLEA